MIEFDKYGNLVPYDIIEMEINPFKKVFIDEMRNKNHREALFNSLQDYTMQIMNIIKTGCHQWINGSFVTRTLKPQDIDVVTFIDNQVFNEQEKALIPFTYPSSKMEYNVDGYLVKTYAKNEENYNLFKSDALYWMHQFLKTRPNRKGQQFNKGFIKIFRDYETKTK